MKTILFFLFLSTTVLQGCNAKRTYDQNTYYQEPKIDKNPKLLGWDENGYKKYEGQVIKKQLELLVTPEKTDKIESTDNSSKKNTSYKKSITVAQKETVYKAVILNEDSILCESDNLLIPKVSEGVFVNTIDTGTNLIAAANLVIRLHELNKDKVSLTQNYLNKLNSIPGANRFNGIDYKAQAKDLLAETTNTVQENEEKFKHATEFLRSCKSTDNPQRVLVIENRPISKISKIKINMNEKPYDLWTYDIHLTDQKI
jgi:hypothetical protein